jgi:hypothetical protein
MQFKLNFWIIIIAISAIIIFYRCTEEPDLIIPFYGKVIDKSTKLALGDARVIYNTKEIFQTDMNGEFKGSYNLKKYLADSISFYVTKANYHPYQYSTIIGNTQKDLFILEMTHR